jgi:hypothetical protein
MVHVSKGKKSVREEDGSVGRKGNKMRFWIILYAERGDTPTL